MGYAANNFNPATAGPGGSPVGFVVPSIAALRAMPPTALVPSAVCTVAGYYAPGDGGGGQFVWSATGTGADDGALTIALSGGGNGRWLRDPGQGGQPTARIYGARGDGATDDTAALQAWLTAGGGHLPVPPGGFYMVTGTLTVPSNTVVRGAGAASVIKLVLPSGAPAILLMVTARGSSNVTLEDFTLDHNAGALTDPATLNGNPIVANCLLFMSSSSRISGLVVKNGWDNGIGVFDIDLSSGSSSPGKPNGVRIDGVYTTNNGCGVHTKSAHPGKIGAGIDVAGGADVVVSNCISFQDYSGFGTDTGGGAQATFVGCTAWLSLMDPANPGNGSGNAFVSQSGQGRFVGCNAFYPGAYGFWFISGPDSGQAVGCQVKGAGYHGFFISSGNILLSACHAQSCGQAASGTYDGFCVATTQTSIANVQVIGCYATDTTGKQRWGYNEVLSGSYTISGGSVIGGQFAGATGSVNTAGSTNAWAPAAAGSFDIDAAGNVSLGGFRGAPAVKVVPSSDKTNQQRVELQAGNAGAGAAVVFNGSGSGQAGNVINKQSADLNFLTGGSITSFKAQYVSGANAFVQATPGTTRVSLGSAGPGANIDLALAPKGAGAVQLGAAGSSTGPVISNGAIADGSGVRVALSGNYTVPNNTSLLRLNQTGTVSSSTLTLPTTVVDGQVIQIVNYAGQVTALTFSPTVNGWTNGNTLSANTGLRIRWDASAAAWYREQ